MRTGMERVSPLCYSEQATLHHSRFPLVQCRSTGTETMRGDHPRREFPLHERMPVEIEDSVSFQMPGMIS
jgi:hypothetical protein